MKKLFLLILPVLFFSNVFAQKRARPEYRLGISEEVFFRSDSQLVHSPVLQFYTGKFNMYFGPEFLLALDGKEYYNRFGYRLGVSYFYKKSNVQRNDLYAQFEINHSNYKFNTLGYDTAVPAIPVQGTIAHERIYTDLLINVGAKHHFGKRYFAGAKVGIGVQWTTFIEPATGNYYQSNYNYETPVQSDIKLNFALEFGLNFLE